jgi:hypothetical protein
MNVSLREDRPGFRTWVDVLLDVFVVDKLEAPHSPVVVEGQDSVVAVGPEQEQPDLMAGSLDWDTSSAARAETFPPGKK